MLAWRLLWGLSWCLSPMWRWLLARRVAADKEPSARVGERQGVASIARPQGKRVVWFHAASLGEVNSLLPLVEAALNQDPELFALVTTFTRSSADSVPNRLPQGAVHQMLPFDVGPWVERFLDHWQPSLLVLAEQELWPIVLFQCHRRALPVLVVNGRLSRGAASSWRWASWFGLSLNRVVTRVLAQSSSQAEQFVSLGIDQVQVTGNLKFATVESGPVAPDTSRPGRWWIAALTHPGEEELALDVQDYLRRQGVEMGLILAPRHVERSDAIAAMLGGRGLGVRRWQGTDELSESSDDVLLVDQFGVMAQVYGQASLCFLGGSTLESVGGHSPIEPLAARVPTVVGPHMTSQASITKALAEHQALIQAPSAEQLGAEVLDLLHSPEDQERQLAGFAEAAKLGQPALKMALAAVQELSRDRAGHD